MWICQVAELEIEPDPNMGIKRERIVRLALQNQLAVNLSQSRPALLLDKLLEAKIGQSQVHDNSDLAA